jgi:DNA-directed RNA polymerase subunit beta'
MSKNVSLDYEAISIHLASSDEIRKWSSGEVKKAETISYRNYKPEPDGLFCEKIFGPMKDYECRCGKYKGKRYEGVVCDRCGVEVTKSRVRRERMGHIELAAPVAHIWYLKTLPYISLLLDMSSKVLQEVVYFVRYLVIDPGDTGLKVGYTLRDEEYRELREAKHVFVAKKGAEAVKEMLSQLDLDNLFSSLKEELKTSSVQKKNKLIKRIGAVQTFLLNNKSPTDMIMDVIPVIPPDLRPLLQLEGGRFATSDLNTLYQRVINRNNRLRKLLEVNAPEIMIQNEKRMLQEAVDALLDNSKRTRPVVGTANRPLRSLSDILKGKEGRFRQNLLGKRVDYSGRSVIVVNPELRLDQCGLPREMVLELFKPFVMERLVSKGIARSLRSAKLKIEKFDPVVWSVLEEVIKDHPVLLNRAPTLHRLGIEGFNVTLCENKAIQIPPLVCTPFNADFDGDQMAVHIPLSIPAIAETETLMMSSRNFMSPANGSPIMSPIQDMVLGIYFLTLDLGKEETSQIFHSLDEVIIAYEHKAVKVNDRVKVLLNGKVIETTVGRAIFNERVKRVISSSGKDYESLGYHNEVFNSKSLKLLIKDCFNLYGSKVAVDVVEEIKRLGFEYVTLPGITIGLNDMASPPNLNKLIAYAEEKSNKLNEAFTNGLLSPEERYQKIIEVWMNTINEIKKEAFLNFRKDNPIHMMITSGARGNPAQVNQMVGIRGLMLDPTGKTIEYPIKNNLRNGLTVLEYFISTHGARKGQADTALKTSDSGYLTRRLVDVAHSVTIKEEDCTHSVKRKIVLAGKVVRPLSVQVVGQIADKDVIVPESGEVIVKEGEVISFDAAVKIDELDIDEVVIRRFVEGFEVSEIVEDGAVVETLEERILGRIAASNIMDEDGRIIVEAGSEIDEQAISKIKKAGIKKVSIRSPLTCLTENGTCAACYGRDLSTGKKVLVGEAVGVIAAQSIGEPGTQLTLRTFHSGGIATSDITGGLPRVEELFEVRRPKGEAYIAEISGKVSIKQEKDFRILKIVSAEGEEVECNIPYNAQLLVKDGDFVEVGAQITQGSLNPHTLLRTRGRKSTEEYLLSEIQKVYKSQGVDINDKHIEIIIHQLIRRVKIKESGDTEFLPGDIIDKNKVDEINRYLIAKGAKPALYEIILLRLTKAASISESFLSAASFQETPKILADAAIKSKIDFLEGLKEAVIVGHPIPAGTGLRDYRKKLGVKSINELFTIPGKEIEDNDFFV